MAKNARYKVAKRRRREGKTNYYKRYEMLKSMKIRAVIRKTNKYVIIQFVYAMPIGDITIASAHSRELVKLFGWKGGTKNTPAAYLTGLLAGLRAKKMGITYAVPDIGLHKPVKGSKIFAVIKGLRDAGIDVPCSEDTFPSEDRIRGRSIAEYARMLNESDPVKYQRLFSAIIRNGLNPVELPEHFNSVYNKIIKVYESVPESIKAKEILQKIVPVL